MLIKPYYRTPAISRMQEILLLDKLHRFVSPDIISIKTELKYHIDSDRPLNPDELKKLKWLPAETFEKENFGKKTFLGEKGVFEVGTRLDRVTPWSTNAVSICKACQIDSITRLEVSRRYHLILKKGTVLSEEQRKKIYSLIHDRMTEEPYLEPIVTFETGREPEPVYTIPLIEEGKSALVKLNRQLGLGMDEWDIDYYTDLFVNKIGRNPTNVECFQLGQANSEHSRHWFWKGKLVFNGQEMPYSLMDIVRQALEVNPNNSVIAFSDNSSAIKGYDVWTIVPTMPGNPSPFCQQKFTYHIVFTSETHNYPSGVEPFAGAETGTGGRQRDNSDTGRGAFIIAGTTGYCVGCLRIPGYPLPWEDEPFVYPKNLASPLEIEIRASDGASDYGNKFGEPVPLGFTRSFDLRLPDGSRYEWIKPIMFTGGIGQMDAKHIKKEEPQKGMLLVKIGGPAYRIGVGGGSASSMLQGENIEELDFNAVQRGDAEMAKKAYNVIRACVEMGEQNPILSIHDQGAGGRCNVETEIINPAGAKIKVRTVQIGDKSLSVLEIWGAEYQEQHAILIWPERLEEFKQICEREKVYCAIVGEITGDGRIVLYDEQDGSTPVNLELAKILGKLPQKTFRFNRIPPVLKPLDLPEGLTVRQALDKVLRLIDVGSKRFLTTKVDRSVGGLIARQQCVGPLQLTLADCAVTAQSHFGLTGSATSIGEQPIKGLVNPAAMGRMAVAEALTNLAGVKISALPDIKCEANWMWAAKLPGEGPKIYDAACAMRDIMIDLGIAVDGGKDSSSMATLVKLPSGETETVKSPGQLVISAYVTVPDITKVITPDIKMPGKSKLLYIDLGKGKYRMGGSALAYVYKQIGDESPDIDDSTLLKNSILAVQKLVGRDLILAYHDRSDGGLITTPLEMSFAGNCGFKCNLDVIKENFEPIRILFSEEAGMLIEYLPKNETAIKNVLCKFNVLDYSMVIAETTKKKKIIVTKGNEVVLEEDMRVLRDIWEETSYQLDRLQANPVCVDEERKVNYNRQGPKYHLSFTPNSTSSLLIKTKVKPKVAIIREEGSNGDREMASAFYLAGFEPWDVTMTDLQKGRISLSIFRGAVFVGGFSYADVMDAGKGWAGVIKFNDQVRKEFEKFFARPDTFSLGICNGCQLEALLGWVPWPGLPDECQPRFIRNTSGRFESRWATVKILPSPAIMLKGMEGSVLGVWVAHGEGKAHFPDPIVLKNVLKQGLAPIRFVDDKGQPTEIYPLNPNGSPLGITALCSSDGRHLAFMDHSERAFRLWQWSWMPADWRKNLKTSPWLKMFQNARQRCEEV